MDIKITGVSREIMERALAQAKAAREAILDRMLQAIAEPRTELAGHAPRISSVQINPEYIGMVIGKGGETIRSLEADYEVQIDIEEDGTILVYATSGEKGDAAIAAITALTKDPGGRRRVHRQGRQDDRLRRVRRAEEGNRRAAARLERRPGRVNHIEDVLQRGDVLDVLVQEVDKARGRIGLKLVQKHENGGFVSPEELVERAKDAPPREPREERPPRDRDRGGRGGGGAARRPAAHGLNQACRSAWPQPRPPRGMRTRLQRAAAGGSAPLAPIHRRAAYDRARTIQPCRTGPRPSSTRASA